MEVLNQTQKVIDLLEEDIKNVDYSKIAKLTGIPIGLYQRIFTYICNISLSSYVRRRRLTLSAEMLLRKEESITQVAMEWGYENSSAFTRAFKEQFTDFEGKSASNHIEVVNKLDNMQKDLNAMEVVTSKNWNDIAQLKAIK